MFLSTYKGMEHLPRPARDERDWLQLLCHCLVCHLICLLGSKFKLIDVFPFPVLNVLCNSLFFFKTYLFSFTPALSEAITLPNELVDALKSARSHILSGYNQPLPHTISRSWGIFTG